MRFENTRPVPQDLATGKVLAPGEEVELSDEEQAEPHNERLIADGVLVSPQPTDELTKDDLRARLEELGAEQPPQKATRDELAAAVAEAENPEKEGENQ